MKNVRLIAATIIYIVFAFPINAFGNSNSLGLALDIIPSTDQEIQKLTNGQSLWFVIPPSSSKYREIRITSTAKVKEEIELSIGFLNRIDGKATIDDSKKSEIADWAKFSDNNFALNPSETKVVKLEFIIPVDSQIGVHEAFLYVTAKSVSATIGSDQYKLRQKARMASPIFLGVGTADQIYTDFEIQDVDSLISDGGKNLRVFFKNTGKTPINLTGSISLSSLEFSNRQAGPFYFNSLPIRAGQDAYVLIPTKEEVTVGKWKIFVSASQLSRTKTKEFTKNLTFKDNLNIIGLAIKLIFAIFFLFLLQYSYRTLRGKESNYSFLRKANNKDQLPKSLNDLTIEDLEKIIASRLDVDSPNEKSKVKKSASNTALKSTANKSARGKTVAKKAAKKPVKKVAKKAATKSPGKKVAKKAVKNSAKKATKSRR